MVIVVISKHVMSPTKCFSYIDMYNVHVPIQFSVNVFFSVNFSRSTISLVLSHTIIPVGLVCTCMYTGCTFYLFTLDEQSDM